MMGFGDAVASAGPCANELYMYLTPDKMETAIKLITIMTVHNVSQCSQSKTQVRPQGTCIKIWMRLNICFLRYARRQTDI